MWSVLRNFGIKSDTFRLSMFASMGVTLIYSLTNSAFKIQRDFIVRLGANVTFSNVVGTSMGFSRFLSSNSKIFGIYAGFIQGVGDICGKIKVVHVDLNYVVYLLVPMST